MMAGPVATCAGSSGGAQPPPDPYRLPSQCMSAPAARARARQPRKGRGLAKGDDIVARVAAEGKIKLSFDQGGRTWKAIGPYAAWYDSAVGIHTRNCCEPFHKSWKDVPARQKAQLRDCMLDWFDINLGNIFHFVLQRDAQKCYKDWKNDLVTHFRKYKTVEEARAHPHSSIRDASHWQRCCDRFSSPEFQQVSNRNKANRQMHKYVSYHGRRSYAQHRAKKANIETQELFSPTENWKDMHSRQGAWANELAEQTYNILEAERRRTQVAQSALGSILVDEYPIMERILGPRRGHITGVGPTLPKSAYACLQCSQSSAETSSAQHTNCEAHFHRLETQLTQVLDAIRRLVPGIQLFRPDAPPSSSNATHDHNDNAAN